MARHSFIRTTKLPDVKGRVDYISNPKRQEHLYATYSTVEPEFWQHLSKQAQHDFWKSNQKKGKCIEARELIIALPESLQRLNPDLLLQLFTEKFREQYGVQCTAALHHNKAMTNYHIHLIFADRNLLDEKQVKYAARNMYFDEEGRHVRTKKEVLGEDGNLRPGCRMVPKGEVYEMKWFSARNDFFKSKAFMNEVKVMYTELINQCVEREEDKLTVFDSSGPYLATRKIGKNNPMADKIRADNELKQKWNQTVDQVLIAGGTIEEVSEFKREEVVKKISTSVSEHGNRPGLLAGIVNRAIDVLDEFLKVLMEDSKPVQIKQNEKEKQIATGKQSKKEKQTLEGKTVDLKQNKDLQKDQETDQKGPRPDSGKEEMDLRKMDGIYQKLIKTNRKIFALEKQKDTLETALNQLPGGILHRKDRKALQDRIDGLNRQLEQARMQLNAIPAENGFGSVKAVKQAYQTAKIALEEVRQKQAEWDGVELPKEQKPQSPQTQKQKVSVLKQLAEKRLKVVEQENKQKKIEKVGQNEKIEKTEQKDIGE